MEKFSQVEELTASELIIVKMFASGMDRLEVSTRLEVREKTLRGYLHNIYQKLGVQKLHQLVVWYFITHFDLVEKKKA